MKIARRQFKVEVPSVAMGDIAFNLLVFFVILAKATDDSHLQWKAAADDKLDVVKHTRASIVIDKDNKLHLNGRQISVQELAKAVEDRLRGEPAGQRTVLLKINNSATADKYEPLLEAVSEAGGEIVHILDKKKEL
jgi:biopolymer transport protein ExbD